MRRALGFGDLGKDADVQGIARQGLGQQLQGECAEQRATHHATWRATA